MSQPNPIPPLAGLGALEFSRNAPALAGLTPEDLPMLLEMVFPLDGSEARAATALRFTLTTQLGADPGLGLGRYLAQGSLRDALLQLARVSAAGQTFALRVAGAASLIVAGRPASAGAAQPPAVDTAALAAWAALPFEEARDALVAVLRAYPGLRAPLAGRWNPDAVLAAAAGWPPEALARLGALSRRSVR